jgi:hypothetical protein
VRPNNIPLYVSWVLDDFVSIQSKAAVDQINRSMNLKITTTTLIFGQVFLPRWIDYGSRSRQYSQ